MARKSIHDERREAFQRGYQAALADVLDKLIYEGADGARIYLEENLTDKVLRRGLGL